MDQGVTCPDVLTRIEGRAGRITLTRPQALNALTHAMSRTIEMAMERWRDDPAVALIVIDAEGPRAFCAGGDVAAVWRESRNGNPEAGRAFWRDEYRMNAALATYPKPVVALMHGFIMGGGVGIGCHVSHRVVDDTAQMAMPEAGIGLIPDVGGTRLLARAPGRLGAYLGLTAARMGPGDAIHAGFADHFIPRADWAALIARLCATGDAVAVAQAAQPVPASPLAALYPGIDTAFAGHDVQAIHDRLAGQQAPWAQDAAQAITRNSPLSMAATLALLRDLPKAAGVAEALRREYRFTWRAAEAGVTDFQEGVRAQLIDKDRQPRWRHPPGAQVPEDEVSALLAPLGSAELPSA